MGTAVAWVSSGLAALAVLAVLIAVISVSGRVRPLRRALRRLSWRREELDRLRTRAGAVQERIEVLAAEVAKLAERRSRPQP